MWFGCLLWIFIEAAPVRNKEGIEERENSSLVKRAPIKTLTQTIQCSFDTCR